ncbi:MAG: hypothetical protein RR398_04000 [Clostridia bacterium]
MICKNCGEKQSSVALFCGVCGARLAPSDEGAAIKAAPPEVNNIDFRNAVLEEDLVGSKENLDRVDNEKSDKENETLPESKILENAKPEPSENQNIDAMRLASMKAPINNTDGQSINGAMPNLSIKEREDPSIEGNAPDEAYAYCKIPNVQKTAPMTMGQYLSSLLIMFIPVVGFIFSFIWACSAKNDNRCNLARAILVLKVIFYIFAIIIALGFMFWLKLYIATNGNLPFAH